MNNKKKKKINKRLNVTILFHSFHSFSIRHPGCNTMASSSDFCPATRTTMEEHHCRTGGHESLIFNRDALQSLELSTTIFSSSPINCIIKINFPILFFHSKSTKWSKSLVSLSPPLEMCRNTNEICFERNLLRTKW